MNNIKTESEIKQYESTKAAYSDYTHFEDEAQERKRAQAAFINGQEYVPTINYPKMDTLAFDEDTIDKKQRLYEAVLELEQAKKYSETSESELELYAGFLENRLKRIMLVEAAENLYDPFVMSDYETNRKTFADLNESLYGKFNESYYLGILNTEKQNLTNFEPKNQLAGKIKSELSDLLGRVDTKGETEAELLTDTELSKLHNFVMDRYQNILDVVPETSDDIYYDVNACAEIINRALIAGGLTDWRAEENSQKTVPASNGVKKRIFLPSNTSRNASELKRLIIHEQEVHARRSYNGEKSGFDLVKIGTANSSDSEEGLAVILECAVSGKLDNASFDRARNRYITAGLALGVDGQARDARETFESLWRLIAVQSSNDGVIDDKDIKSAQKKAYSHIENAYRGTQFWMKGVIYSKLKIYYEGLVANADYFKQNIDNLDAVFEDLFIGKYDHTDKNEKELIFDIIKSRSEHNEK